MEIKGTIVEIFNEQQVTGSFRKREFVVEYAENPQYPELIKFECIQDNCDQLDKFGQGQEVTISFNLKGRKWTNQKGEDVYFNSLQAWRIIEETEAPKKEPEPVKVSDQADDDLPF